VLIPEVRVAPYIGNSRSGPTIQAGAGQAGSACRAVPLVCADAKDLGRWVCRRTEEDAEGADHRLRSEVDPQVDAATVLKEILMLTAITATDAGSATVAKVVDEMVRDGIPREKIYRDEDTMEAKAMVADVGIAGIQALLSRHAPIRMI
jgi:hypothetical protein